MRSEKLEDLIKLGVYLLFNRTYEILKNTENRKLKELKLIIRLAEVAKKLMQTTIPEASKLIDSTK